MVRRSLIAFTLLAVAGCAKAPPPRTAVVFFNADSAALDANAQSAIQEASDTWRATPFGLVHVRGFAAPDAGSTAFNNSLAQTRAQAVSDALRNAGVPQSSILVESRGAVPFDLMPIESRRVEIVVTGR